MQEYWKKVHDEALAGMQGLIDKLTKDTVLPWDLYVRGEKEAK